MGPHLACHASLGRLSITGRIQSPQRGSPNITRMATTSGFPWESGRLLSVCRCAVLRHLPLSNRSMDRSFPGTCNGQPHGKPLVCTGHDGRSSSGTLPSNCSAQPGCRRQSRAGRDQGRRQFTSSRNSFSHLHPDLRRLLPSRIVSDSGAATLPFARFLIMNVIRHLVADPVLIEL